MTATVIDLSRLPLPAAIEALDFEALFLAFVDRFKAQWQDIRAANPDFPDYDVETLETDPVVIAGQAWAYLRLLDRQRVNDAVKAVLAPTATGTDLDNVVARTNVERLEIAPATSSVPAVMESDTALLRRYLLSFDRPSAGSADRYLFEAYSTVPTLHHAAVIGRAVHGRLGETDIVIAGPNGAVATSSQIAAVRAAVLAPDVKPEATGVTVLPAVQSLYTVSLTIEVPTGPDPAVIVEAVRARVLAAARERMQIGQEVPADVLSAAAYQIPNVMRVTRLLPIADIASHPYTIPVCSGVNVECEVRA